MRSPSMLPANSAIKRPLDRLQSADLICAWPLLHGNSLPPVRRRAFRPPQIPPPHKVRKTQLNAQSQFKCRAILLNLLPASLAIKCKTTYSALASSCVMLRTPSLGRGSLEYSNIAISFTIETRNPAASKTDAHSSLAERQLAANKLQLNQQRVDRGVGIALERSEHGTDPIELRFICLSGYRGREAYVSLFPRCQGNFNCGFVDMELRGRCPLRQFVLIMFQF